MPTNNHSDNLFDAEAPLDDEQLWDLLSLYVDGEADPAQAAIVEQMLSSDPAYRRDFDFLMQSSQTMHMIEELEPPISLRDAVYAKTTGRPTLLGRLQAAWSRATTPAFGRNASIAGAFAVAVLGTVILWPRLASTPGHTSSVQPPVVAVVNTPVPPAVATNPMSSRIPDINPATIDPAVTLRKPPLQPKLANNTHPIKPSFVPEGPKVGLQSENKVAKTRQPAPHNYRVIGNNTPPNDGNLGAPLKYPYETKMDEKLAPHQVASIVSSPGNDFGPKVAISDETLATTPHTLVQPTSVGGNKVTPDSNPPVDPPKKTVRVATLPPGDKQVIAESVLRKTQTAQYGGYDRAVADNIQNHELLFTVKSSF